MFDKAIEFEKILIRRMKKRCREGKVRNEIADFFEYSDKCNEIFVIMSVEKKKAKPFAELKAKPQKAKDATQ